AFHPGETAAPPKWFHDRSQATSAKRSRYLVAITQGPLKDDERAQLASLGAEILGYLPVHGYRLRMAPPAEAAIRRLPFVVWLGAVPAHLKVESELAGNASAPAAATRIRVVLAAGESQQRTLDALNGFS